MAAPQAAATDTGDASPRAGDESAEAPAMAEGMAPGDTAGAETADTGAMAEDMAAADQAAGDTAEAEDEIATDAGTVEEAEGPVPGQLGRPGVSLLERGTERRSERLPSVTGQSSGQSVGQSAGEATATTAAAPAEDTALPPIERYAVPFENPEDKPLMSILLLDDGTSATSTTALSEFPYPLTIALDPSWDGAPEAMRRYRAAGMEVAILADMPETATASDMETNYQVWSERLPETVAVMEGDDTGLQAARPASDQLADILAASGRGLVLYPNGLDTARKLAVRKGVPAATVFRDFDSDGQTSDVIRRFLDHAAFRAGQEGGVIMVGRLRAETVQALLVWGLQDRASRVALAPVSALLMSSLPE